MEIPATTPIDRVQIPIDKPKLALAICKQQWIEDQRRPAFTQLETLTATLHRLIERSRGQFAREQLEISAKLTAKCYLKLGEWHSQMHPPLAVLVNAVSGTEAVLGGTPRSARTPIGVAQSQAFQQPSQFYRNAPLQK